MLRTTGPDQKLDLCLVHKILGTFSSLIRGLVGVEEGRGWGTKTGNNSEIHQRCGKAWVVLQRLWVKLSPLDGRG